MTGKEQQLATDPECSAVLERMAYSMDDFTRRVFVDSLTGSLVWFDMQYYFSPDDVVTATKLLCDIGLPRMSARRCLKWLRKPLTGRYV